MKTNFSTKVCLPLALAAVFLAGADSSLLAQADAAGATPQTTVTTANSFGQVAIKSAQIAEIDNTHIRIAVDLSATPNRSVTLENLRLAELRLNGLPVYAEPLSEPIELVKGKDSALPPLYITAQLRDLTTTKPLREMIENQTVHITGQLLAGVKMGFLERLAVHTQHPRISLAVNQDVPVAAGASPLARQAALGILSVIDLGMQGSSVARKTIPGLESPWIHDLETEARTDLMTVETSFVLKERDKAYPVVFDQLGFRLASGQIVTTSESKAPWEYDVDFLTRIKSGEAKLEKKSVEIQLKASGAQGDAALTLTHKDFSLEERGNPDKDPLLISKPADPSDPDSKGGIAKINVRRRSVPDAVVLMILQAPPAAGGFHAAPAAILQQDAWEKVAVFRLMLDSATGKTSVEVVQISARRDGQAIHLNQSVDSSFFGSPIVAPEGVIGFVQDEQAGAFLPADLATAAATADSGTATPAATAGIR